MDTSKDTGDKSFEELVLDKIKGPQEKKASETEKDRRNYKGDNRKICAKNLKW